MEQYDASRTLKELGAYQTNKDQMLGSIIAKAALLIAEERRRQTELHDTTDNGMARWTQQAQDEAGRH